MWRWRAGTPVSSIQYFPPRPPPRGKPLAENTSAFSPARGRVSDDCDCASTRATGSIDAARAIAIVRPGDGFRRMDRMARNDARVFTGAPAKGGDGRWYEGTVSDHDVGFPTYETTAARSRQRRSVPASMGGERRQGTKNAVVAAPDSASRWHRYAPGRRASNLIGSNCVPCS